VPCSCRPVPVEIRSCVHQLSMGLVVQVHSSARGRHTLLCKCPVVRRTGLPTTTLRTICRLKSQKFIQDLPWLQWVELSTT
jgi:hypothetical protein